jgi:hypothetical protein
MNLIKRIIENYRHKKCVKAFERIKKDLKYSTSHTAILYIATEKGYDELFEKIKNKGWNYRIEGNNREGVFLTVKGTLNIEN